MRIAHLLICQFPSTFTPQPVYLMNSLFRRKPISSVLKNIDVADDINYTHGLKRTLTARDLTFFGIAAIIGAGSFSSLGSAIFNGGPGVVVLFVITGIACAFTAYCYSEFATRIPVSGSAYTYAYTSFGELFAWIIGWALIMEYSIGNIYVAFSWSDYFTSFLEKTGINVADHLSCSYLEAKKLFTEYTASLNTTSPMSLTSAQNELKNAWEQAPVIGGLRIILISPHL